MINPSVFYGIQVDTSDPTGFPFGKAKNVSTAGAGDGTPLEQAWLNDWWGFQAAAMNNASLTPSGLPDQADGSQLFQALERRFAGPAMIAIATSLNVGQGAPVTFAAIGTNRAGLDGSQFTLASSVFTVPVGGIYQCSLVGHGFVSETTSPFFPEIMIAQPPGFPYVIFQGARWSANTGHRFPILGSFTLPFDAGDEVFVGSSSGTLTGGTLSFSMARMRD